MGVSVAATQQHARHAIVGEAYVDGGIIGPLAHKQGTTRLYLSGKNTGQVAGWFSDSKLQAIELSGGLTPASALKLCYAAYNEGVSALILAVRALAINQNVESALLSEWTISRKGLQQRSEKIAQACAPKAWRFSGVMDTLLL